MIRKERTGELRPSPELTSIAQSLQLMSQLSNSGLDKVQASILKILSEDRGPSPPPWTLAELQKFTGYLADSYSPLFPPASEPDSLTDPAVVDHREPANTANISESSPNDVPSIPTEQPLQPQNPEQTGASIQIIDETSTTLSSTTYPETLRFLATEYKTTGVTRFACEIDSHFTRNEAVDRETRQLAHNHGRSIFSTSFQGHLLALRKRDRFGITEQNAQLMMRHLNPEHFPHNYKLFENLVSDPDMAKVWQYYRLSRVKGEVNLYFPDFVYSKIHVPLAHHFPEYHNCILSTMQGKAVVAEVVGDNTIVVVHNNGVEGGMRPAPTLFTLCLDPEAVPIAVDLLRTDPATFMLAIATDVVEDIYTHGLNCGNASHYNIWRSTRFALQPIINDLPFYCFTRQTDDDKVIPSVLFTRNTK